jgi:DNA-binding Lrp family transcriptional regulator
MNVREDFTLDDIDRRLILASQAGLPLEPRPYHALAARLELTPEEVMARFTALLERGVVRRIAAVPNHYRLGYRANAMSVWDVDDASLDSLGPRVGSLSFVSHCYRRPRRRPQWPYNLFAMVHGADRDEVSRSISAIADVLGSAARAHDLLYSSRILKKSGLRLGG